MTLTRRLKLVKPGIEANNSLSDCRFGVELRGWTADEGAAASVVAGPETGLLPDVVTVTETGELPDVPDDAVPLLLTTVSPAADKMSVTQHILLTVHS